MENISAKHAGKKVVIDTDLKVEDIVFYDTKSDPFEVYGLYNYRNETPSRRLPENVAAATSEKVAYRALLTSGGRVRFMTDSPYIAIKCVMPHVNRLPHMSLSGTAGFDIYVDSEGSSRFVKLYKPDMETQSGYEGVARFASSEPRCVTINFPAYNPVSELYIGIKDGSALSAGKPYSNKRPIVFYGSSITQGACASRPGLIYENIISRNCNLDYINLGFSSSCLAEDAIVEYMASLDMSVFVSDYDHNAPSVEHLRSTHRKMYETIRAAHPDIPYIMLSKPEFIYDREDSAARRDVIIDTYRFAREKGDKWVYYIDGDSMMRGVNDDCCTVDGTHPSDFGMVKMADAVECVLHRIMAERDILN